MSVSSSRRLLAYGLLLLVPTLLAGLGAVHLLQREQARLAEREAHAGAARRAAVEARSALIVENLELLVGDVRSGLLDTLAAMPAASLETELTLWQRNNPLVRAAFGGAAADRRLQVVPAGEEGRSFQRRLARLIANGELWRGEDGGGLVLPEVAAMAADVPESVARAAVSANVSKMQAARQDARMLAQSRDYRVAAAPEAERVSSAMAPAPRREALPVPATEQRGWSVVTAEGRRMLLGWIYDPGTGAVRGLELELAALIARLGDVLPAEVGEGEGYGLRDESGRVMHQVGQLPRAERAAEVQVALADALLPGWKVEAFITVPAVRSGAGAGFFAVGLFLVGAFMVAILAGGALLLAQARRSEAEAAQKTSFVANVSHEFKTPLTTIRLYAELLAEGRVTDAERRTDYLRTIGRETERLSRLVGNALDFSRLEQGQKKYARAECDAAAVLGQLCDTQEPRLTEAGLVLHRVLPTAPLPVTTDRDALEQIVLNLVDNALKYAATGGELRVELAARAAGGIAVRISDRGPGVPPAHRERIFEKFHRVDDSLTAEKPGTGLGLGIARQLARGLGGNLTYSARAGGGATFILELP